MTGKTHDDSKGFQLEVKEVAKEEKSSSISKTKIIGVVAIGAVVAVGAVVGAVFLMPESTTDSTQKPPPKEPPTQNPTQIFSKVVKLDLGSEHTCAITDEAELYCWGSNLYGQVGSNTTDQKHLSPVLISLGSSDLHPIEVALGSDHTCAITNDNSTFCWGANWHGQVGDRTSKNNRKVPAKIDFGSGNGHAVQIALGWEHSCVLTSTNALLCWGRNIYGEIGDGTQIARLEPTLISLGSNGEYATQIALRHWQTCAVTNEAKLKCWGSNSQAYLGTGNYQKQLTPADIVLGPDDRNVTQVDMGTSHTCVITSDSDLMCCGDNEYGQLGFAVRGDKSTLTDVSLSWSNEKVKQIATGGSHSCALTVDNYMTCFGFGMDGQLGDGNDFDNYPFEQRNVTMSAGVYATYASLGGYHSCFIRNDGALMCFGRNWMGQLGIDSIEKSLTPTRVIL